MTQHPTELSATILGPIPTNPTATKKTIKEKKRHNRHHPEVVFIADDAEASLGLVGVALEGPDRVWQPEEGGELCKFFDEVG